jgi:hypothetical protein
VQQSISFRRFYFVVLSYGECGGGNALQYLEEKFPDRRPLLPKDLVQRAHIYQAVYLISANIQPAQNLSILTVIDAKLGSEERLKWGQGIVEKGFTGLILFSLTIFRSTSAFV